MKYSRWSIEQKFYGFDKIDNTWYDMIYIAATWLETIPHKFRLLFMEYNNLIWCNQDQNLLLNSDKEFQLIITDIAQILLLTNQRWLWQLFVVCNNRLLTTENIF